MDHFMRHYPVVPQTGFSSEPRQADSYHECLIDQDCSAKEYSLAFVDRQDFHIDLLNRKPGVVFGYGASRFSNPVEDLSACHAELTGIDFHPDRGAARSAYHLQSWSSAAAFVTAETMMKDKAASTIPTANPNLLKSIVAFFKQGPKRLAPRRPVLEDLACQPPLVSCLRCCFHRPDREKFFVDCALVDVPALALGRMLPG